MDEKIESLIYNNAHAHEVGYISVTTVTAPFHKAFMCNTMCNKP